MQAVYKVQFLLDDFTHALVSLGMSVDSTKKLAAPFGL